MPRAEPVLRGSILDSNFYMSNWLKNLDCQLSLEKNNVIAIIVNFWILVNLGIVLSLFWKFLLGHFIFGYKDEFLSNRSDFWFQIILKVCRIGFLENIKNGAQNGAPPYFQLFNISIVYGKIFYKCWNVQNLKIWRGSILGSIFYIF